MLNFCSDHAHPFNKIPLLSSPLLNELKEHCLTMELNEHVPRVTGIPPHVEHIVQCEDLKSMSNQMIDSINGFRQDLCSAVSNAIDQKVEADGNVNAAILESSLKGLESRMIEKINEIGNTGAQPAPVPEAVDTNGVDLSRMQQRRVGAYDSFMYNGKFWCVPEDFKFPVEVTRLVGWRMWLIGKSIVFRDKMYAIKPFHLWKSSDLPNKKLQTEFDTKWKPIFRLMMKAPGIPDKIPNNAGEEFVKETFDIATNFLKETVSYIWKKDEGHIGTYKIGTWSRKVQPSEVRKHGTESDIAKLGPVTARNKTHSRKRGGWSIDKQTVRKVNKTSRRYRRANANTINNAFADNFKPDGQS